MSILHNSIKRSVVKVYHEEDTDLLGNICSRTSLDCDTGGGGEVITGPNMEAEKRIRREIANSNERRRMQSINAGFQSLRTLLPHHEGEKLSKAAILQQTAEYIYNLEQEKTRLLSQNCQLMRQVQQHEGDVPPKKRIKTEIIMPPMGAPPHQMSVVSAAAAAVAISGGTLATATAISESSDEGLGSMSPEPVAMVSKTVCSNELTELRRQLDRERTLRLHLEDQVRTMESLYQQQIQCQYQEQQQDGDESIVTVIQETTGGEDDDDDDNNDQNTIEMQLIQAENVPLVGQTETVVCCSSRSSSPLRSSSPPDAPTAVVSECPPRLPSVLEAAIKAEPKVEVERLPSSPSPPASDDVNCSRLYVANTSRQNLETIVEAIRHLEGDHLFSDEPPTQTQTLTRIQPQDVPLALTTSNKQTKIVAAPPSLPLQTERLKIDRSSIKVEMNHYLQFHTQQQHQQQQQSRPGVIVVKQHS